MELAACKQQKRSCHGRPKRNQRGLRSDSGNGMPDGGRPWSLIRPRPTITRCCR